MQEEEGGTLTEESAYAAVKSRHLVMEISADK